jgi:hypothetical protein
VCCHDICWVVMVIVGPSILVSLAEGGNSTTIHDGFLHEFFSLGFLRFMVLERLQQFPNIFF